MIDSHHLQFIQLLGRSYRTFVAGFEAHTGQSMARWRILVLLDRQGEMSQKQLVQELGIDPAALTRQLKALEQADMVRRHSDAQDARLTNVTLTKAGRKVVASTMAQRNEYLEWALADLSVEDMNTLSKTLVKLEQHLAQRPNTLKKT
ncbi:MarR family transcriptional regulator [Achromobacter sp. F4_2707]|uniref:MarR family winged helix-turn-helix transcriptional regulator n=1 Tax=Achromobacter sp. F4_2707 TaxID=3114286 RepID=UPI0039C68C73